MTAGFAHLHLHTEYSLLDGGNRIDKLVARVAELGMKACAVTDHGNLFGAVAFYQACKDKGVKPILGVEAYVTPPGKPRTDRTYSGGGEGGYHLVLLAENNTGWQNLLVLCSQAYLTGFYYKPRIDRDLLEKHSEGLIAINGHLGSEIGDHLLDFKRSDDRKFWDAAVESAQWHDRVFNGARQRDSETAKQGAEGCGPVSLPGCFAPRFFIELQHHVPEQNAINPLLIRLARELRIPLVCDNDAHFLKAEDHDAHDTLICISTGKGKSDANRMRYPTEVYVKSPDQMEALFAPYADAGREALDNACAIADRCNVTLPMGVSHAPMVRVSVRSPSGLPEGVAGPRAGGGRAARGADAWPIDALPRHDDPRFAGDLTAWYKAYCACFDVIPFAVPDDAGDAERASLLAQAKSECDRALRLLAEAGMIWRYGLEETKERRNEETKRTRTTDASHTSSPRPSVSASLSDRTDRLNRELRILADKNISAYFLIVWDFVNWGRQHAIPSTARGSGVGTMVGYVLGLSNACPVHYGLLFERFTDPDRSEYPDIDIDLCQDGRAAVINYVREKYGHVAQIITFGTLKARAAVRDVGRVLEIPLPEVDKIAKLIPEQLGITVEDAIAQEPDLRKLYEGDPKVRRLLDNARAIEGQARHASVHAAGVIVATRPLDQIVPLYRQPGTEGNEIVTQWDGPTCEKMGLLKMDFLGLRTLSVIERCKTLIRETMSEEDVWRAVGRAHDHEETKGRRDEETKGRRDEETKGPDDFVSSSLRLCVSHNDHEETKGRRDEETKGPADSVSSSLRLCVSHPLDLDRLTYDDQHVFELFRRGETTGVFQFESGGMRRLLVEMKPDRLEDLIAANALFRPGPMDLIPDYNRRKHGQDAVPGVHDIVDAFTRETYGVMVYQEQVMQIVHGLGGIKLRDAYTLIKNISKKKHDKIEKERPKFVDGAQKKGLSKHAAEELFELILKFAGYGFNKSHSTGYAIVAYQTAYLKTYFPDHYMAAFLTYESGANKVSDWIPYLEDCRRTRHIDPATGATTRVGVEVRPPDINLSRADFAVVRDTPSSPSGPIAHSPLPDAAHVRFGLKALKGVGDKAIEQVIADREKAGPFTSLFDFCERMPAGVITRPMLEALIKCGAMDSLHGRAARSAMCATIDAALSAGQSLASDRASGQNALFGGGPSEPAAGTAAKVPLARTDPWSEAETLANEKDALGFYVSSHPLDRWKSWYAPFITCPVAGVKEMPQDSRVVLAAMIQSVRTLIVKNGKSAGQKMAILTAEDTTGAFDAVLFSDNYLKYAALVEPEKVVFILGRVDLSRGDPQVIVDRLAPIDGMPLDNGKLRLFLDSMKFNGHAAGVLASVSALVRAAAGSNGAVHKSNGHVNGTRHADTQAVLFPVELIIGTEDQVAILATDPTMRVPLAPPLMKSLEDQLGPGMLRVVGGVTVEREKPKPWERRGRGEE